MLIRLMLTAVVYFSYPKFGPLLQTLSSRGLNHMDAHTPRQLSLPWSFMWQVCWWGSLVGL